jgi:hypothetical protein
MPIPYHNLPLFRSRGFNCSCDLLAKAIIPVISYIIGICAAAMHKNNQVRGFPRWFAHEADRSADNTKHNHLPGFCIRKPRRVSNGIGEEVLSRSVYVHRRPVDDDGICEVAVFYIGRGGASADKGTSLRKKEGIVAEEGDNGWLPRTNRPPVTVTCTEPELSPSFDSNT